MPPTLTLDVGQLFGNQVVLHQKDIDAAHMALCSGGIDPGVLPAHNRPHAQAEDLLDLNMRMWRIAKEIVPELCDGCRARIWRAIRSRARVLEDTIIALELHHPGHIMAVKRFVERKHSANTRFDPIHA